MSYESKKKTHFYRQIGEFLKDSMSLAGCQINPIDVNFYLQNSFESSYKNSAVKIWSKKDKGVKSALPHHQVN